MTNTEARPFVPANFDVPSRYRTKHFILVPLTPDLCELDYAAVMASAPLLRAMLGPEWPREGFTYAENLADLEEHAAEFKQHTAFAYSVLDHSASTCLGCVYINPPRGYPTDARVFLWARPDASIPDLDRILFHAVKTWISNHWPFRNVWFPRREADGSWQPYQPASAE